MANEVFANDLEIACKKADGISSCSFPDPCWSPPSPSAGWIMIPYANTTFAKDASNGSKTVLISGKEVMKKDISFFKTSTGNEPAAGPLGKNTGVKKGKAYFTSWSMNVKVEGKNVVRHTDGMTHNHGSKPGNTGINTYIDTKNAILCKKTTDDVKTKCGIKKKENNKFIAKAKKRNKGRRKNNKPEHTVRQKTWKDKHCAKALFQFDKPKELEKKLEEITEDMDDLKGDLIDAIQDKALEIGKAKMERKAEATLGCGAAGGTFGAAIGVWFGGVGAAPGAAAGASAGAAVCNAGLLVKDVFDFAGGAIDMVINRAEVLDKLNKIIDPMEKFEDLLDAITEPDKVEKAKKLEQLEKEMQESVKNDPCLKAKKCILVPHTAKEDASKLVIDKHKAPLKDSLFGFDNPSGCCPGQTGHHLISNATLKGVGGDKARCDGKFPGKGKKIGSKNHTGYVSGAAPTVCAEGTNGVGGSHGELHTQYDATVKAMVNGKYEKDGKVICQTFTMDCAMDAAVDAHEKAFPEADCDPACIKSQLKDYYDPLNCTASPVDKNKHLIAPAPAPAPAPVPNGGFN